MGVMGNVFIITLDGIMVFADDTISLMISLAFCPLSSSLDP